ncbi:hypothetical protein KSD_81880 [Ktedonobacter sp. SOSP1-85]|nr:hypothetical protein KSD_81880 [Ktedonobacter sp. SOSP1-85]
MRCSFLKDRYLSSRDRLGVIRRRPAFIILNAAKVIISYLTVFILRGSIHILLWVARDFHMNNFKAAEMLHDLACFRQAQGHSEEAGEFYQ